MTVEGYRIYGSPWYVLVMSIDVNHLMVMSTDIVCAVAGNNEMAIRLFRTTGNIIVYVYLIV